MAALPYQIIAPRRKVLSSVGRTATCVLLAITGLMSAAMTWTPVPNAAACAGASSLSATCQGANISFSALADAVDFSYTDIPRIHPVVTHTSVSVHRTTKTTSTHQTSSTGSSGTGAAATGGLPCQESYMFVPNINQWSVPPGCYGNIYYPDRTVYHAPGNFGYCNWWVLALHPTQQNILYGTGYTHSSTPVPGAVVWFDPYVQGAGADGHWAQLVAISPDHYWLLITEMNFSWRGGGWGRVDFRYIHVGPGIRFIY